ncbi:hypothetical protein [Stenotrophomonas sp.]|uniref:hypothetical protein n=1 Tax=Stenotrophomonas sp. TaxID=69392 RepID=UPI0028B1C051|nr:hypothetical protein [Stenotrophomonas sp.]
MPALAHTLLRHITWVLAWIPAVLMTACTVPPGAASPVSVHNVRAVDIRYTHDGWGHTDEVHRLQRGASQRTYTRTSSGTTFDGVSPATATVPAQRVGELLWALSAPAWPRERAVQVVARRVRPASVLAHASGVSRERVPGCSADQIRNRIHSRLQGGALRAQLDDYYVHGFWTDDYPTMRVVIEYDTGPPKVITSSSQKLLMLPWVLGEQPAQGERAPQNWSVPMSDALRRLLPPASSAAIRLGRDESTALASTIEHAAVQDCRRASKGT